MENVSFPHMPILTRILNAVFFIVLAVLLVFAVVFSLQSIVDVSNYFKEIEASTPKLK